MDPQPTVVKSRNNIRAALLAAGKSSFEVSTALGKNRSYLDDFLRGKKLSISSDFLQRMSAFLRVDRDVLEGRVDFSHTQAEVELRSTRSDDDISSYLTLEAEVAHLDSLVRDGGIGVEKEIAAAALQDAKRRLDLLRLSNAMASSERAEKWAAPRQFAAELGTEVEDLRSLKIIDSAMVRSAGGFGPGDYVIFDRQNRSVELGGIFVLVRNSTLLVRQVDPGPEGQGQFICRAFNPDYPNIEMKGSNVRGKVVAHIRRV